MQSLLLRSLLVAVCCYWGQNAFAETTGWSWGPFASSTTKSEVGATSKASSWMPQWKMPDVTGSAKKATKKVTDTTTKAWNSAARTTKRAWNKTTDFLDPFPDDPKSSSSSSSKSSSTSSWWGGAKKDEKPATVQDFLRQERP